MVLRAKAPKRSAMSSCAGPKTRRKSLARNLPNLLAANAVIVFTPIISKTVRCYHSGRKLKGERRADTLPIRTQCNQPDRVNKGPCLFMARNGHADSVAQCPLLGAKRKTFARIELFRF